MASRAFTVYTSNRLDVLLEQLAGVLKADPLPPLRRETIVVQSQGMRRWVSLELAKKLGCVASLSMPFPGAFCHRLVDAFAGEPIEAGDEDPTNLFSRDALTWRTLQVLDEKELDPVFEPLRAYISEGGTGVRFDLASRIGAVFDNYQIYRPELLVGWEEGAPSDDPLPHEAWQAALWKRFCKSDRDHLGRRFLELTRSLEKLRKQPEGLPERLAVFGVSSLPSVFIELLRALARFLPVSVYLVTPICMSAPLPTPAASDEPSLPRNPLHRSWGRQGREFVFLLSGPGGRGASWKPLGTRQPEGDSCLARLQRDLLEDRDRTAPDSTDLHELADGDDSLQVHDCHSPLREMEVLRDLLLRAFEDIEDLRPEDVLVLVPDIETYAPYIEAVFGVKHEGSPSLPYRIADRSRNREEPLGELFLRVLRLARARVTSVEVMDLLEAGAVSRKAGLTASEVAVARDWVRALNIRWGVDGEHRFREFGTPPIEANSWRAGIRRLLMGYATGPHEGLVAGVLPYGETTASRADLLGRLVSWLETLFRLLEGLRRPRPVSDWVRDLGRMMEDLFDPDEETEVEALQEAREVLARAGSWCSRIGFDTPIELAVVAEVLDRSLGEEGFGRGFISGSVTFCALKPMRTIPFRVIAVAGLDDASFPRRDRPPAFDLLGRDPRPGDRCLREDDKQLFLETLLASSDRLLLSYVGRSQKNNKKRAPSVVLSELLDTIDRSFDAGENRTPRDRIVVQHKLQPFSPAYYSGAKESDARLFSYSVENCDAGIVSCRPRRTDAPFVSNPLPDPEERPPVGLNDLVGVWSNPSRFFCLRVLGLSLGEWEDDLEEVEAVNLGGLDVYKLKHWMVERHVRGGIDAEEQQALLAAEGGLPPEALGRAWQEKARGEIAPFLDTLGRPAFHPTAHIEVVGDGWVLQGELDGLTKDAQLFYRPARCGPKDLIRAWIRHLALCASSAPGPRTTRIVAVDGSWRFGPVKRASEILDTLVKGYEAGHRAPLPVYENSSFLYAEQVLKLETGSRSKASPLDAARKGWQTKMYRRGDDQDPYIVLCTRGSEPFEGDTSSFEALAEEFWRPLLSNRKDES